MKEKGVLCSPDEVQNSPGDLNSPFSPPGRYFEKSIEPLDLDGIQHFSGIPDFIDPTRSLYPIVVKSPSSLQCIDGWDLIEEAKQRSESALTCEIIHIQRDSEIEYALWKASVRTMPIGGRCIYPEKVRNTCRLFKMLDETTENSVIFSHGGARRGENYSTRSENNISLVLADRLGKSVTTINKYLQHGNYLSEEALHILIAAGVQKGFFEAIQKDKQRLIDDLKTQQKSHNEIVNVVSDRVLSWLEGTQTSESVKIVITQIEPDEPPAIEVQPQQIDVLPLPEKPIAHKHWSGNPSAELEKQPTEEEIYQEFISVGQLLIETAENKVLSSQDRIEIFSDQIIRQTLLIQHLKHLLAQQSINGEE